MNLFISEFFPENFVFSLSYGPWVPVNWFHISLIIRPLVAGHWGSNISDTEQEQVLNWME